MAQDFYAELGVSRTASEDEIKKAYRKLAAELHPDRNQGKPDIEERFKRVNSAYHVVSDPKKRALYDEFGEEGLRDGFDPSMARAYRSRGARAGGMGGPNLEDLFQGGGASGGFGDIFGDLFGGGRGRKRPRRSPDVQSEVTIEFVSAARGAELELSVSGGRTVKVRIPPGAADGDKLRVKGAGYQGEGGASDLILTLRVKPHAHFERDGLDLKLNLPITVAEAYLGAKIEIPTLSGSVQLKVPAGAQSGQLLRLRGKGIARGERTGDLYVRFLVRLPTEHTEELEAAARALGDATSPDLRTEIKL